MFIPNKTGILKRKTGVNIYGVASYDRGTPVPIGVVRLEVMSDPTSVRADSTASRGSAMEETALSRVLLSRNVKVARGDVLVIDGVELVVQSIWPRYAVSGALDHVQLDLLIHT